MLVTSLRTDSTPADALDMLAAEAGHYYLLRTPLLPISINGAGDAIAALFLHHRMTTGQAAAALENAASTVFGLLSRTVAAGTRELQLIAAQEEIVAPSMRFACQTV